MIIQWTASKLARAERMIEKRIVSICEQRGIGYDPVDLGELVADAVSNLAIAGAKAIAEWPQEMAGVDGMEAYAISRMVWRVCDRALSGEWVADRVIRPKVLRHVGEYEERASIASERHEEVIDLVDLIDEVAARLARAEVTASVRIAVGAILQGLDGLDLALTVQERAGLGRSATYAAIGQAKNWALRELEILSK